VNTDSTWVTLPAHERAALSITLHDVAPATQARCEQLIRRIERIAPVPLTLLVVPRYQGQPTTPVFDHWLDARLHWGDELALHGLTHRDEAPPPRGWIDHMRRRWYTAGEGEFAAIDASEATRRLNAGRRWFARRGWPLRGFVAPAWLLGDGAWRALRRQPFHYTCTRTALLALTRGTPDAPLPALHARSIVYSTRARWRRAMSLQWNAMVARGERRQPWMRFELHPSDVEHPAVCSAALNLIARAVNEGRQPLTLDQMAERLRAEADSAGPRAQPRLS